MKTQNYKNGQRHLSECQNKQIESFVILTRKNIQNTIKTDG